MNKTSVLMIIFIVLGFGSQTVGAKEVVGWIEKVGVYPGDIRIKAKIDTGAKTSSLHCECIHPVKRDGKDWVSFGIDNGEGHIVHIEKPVLRMAKIKRHFGKRQERIVIRLGLCLGSLYREEEVTLVDRAGLNYQLLVGRNYLEGFYLVDAGKTFITSPSCTVKNK